jgi:putative FmdB family regulatory protein
MPTYEYRCKRCRHELEMLQSFTDAPLTRCPKCRKMGLERLIGAGAGIIFKGSGFYATDYKKGSAGRRETPADTSGSTPPKSEEKASGSDEGSD